MKVKVPVIGTVNRSIAIEADAPSRAEVTAQIAAALQGTTQTAGGGSGVVSVIWRFIREVPANIVKLAALGTNGLITRKANGDIIVRSIAVADSSRLTITNADGDAGSPTLDVADIASHTIIARDSGSTGKPAATGLSAVLDFLGSVAQGDLLYRAASNWAYLAPGSADQPLWSGGASANPSWGRKILAGTNITFDDSVSGQRTIAAASSSGANVTPDTHPVSPNALDDEFEAGSLDAKWTQQNSPTSVVLANGSVLIIDASNTADNIGVIEQSTTGSFTIYAKTLIAAGLIDNRGGMYIRESTNSKGYTFGQFYDGTWNRWYINRMNGFTSAASGAFTSTSAVNVAGPNSFAGKYWQYQSIDFNAGTGLLTFSASVSGVVGTYVPLYSENISVFLGSIAPNRVGLYGDRGTATSTPFVCDWFRKF